MKAKTRHVELWLELRGTARLRALGIRPYPTWYPHSMRPA